MQVRKFEAKTMKDALEMVKQHLGPEAIILSAKDNSRGFGLMGESSVEVTAAVSDETLRRKKMAESKLRDGAKERYASAPARVQKQFINRVYERKTEAAVAAGNGGGGGLETTGESRSPATRRPPSVQRYIDIPDEDPQNAERRIRDAAERARSASRGIMTGEGMVARKPTYGRGTTAHVPVTEPLAPPPRQAPLLESQIGELKTILENFHKTPQPLISAHPGAEEGVPFELSHTYQGLRRAGLDKALIVEWLNTARQDIDREGLKKDIVIDAWLIQKMLKECQVTVNPIEGRYHVFVGTTAQGKTSTLVKMASQLILQARKRIALVSLDTLKVGAADQLKIYAQILNVPFAVIRSPSEWALLEDRLRGVDHILVDLPGLNLKTREEADWAMRILPPARSRKVHFVQSALARDEECLEIAARYRAIGFDDVIFTRLDETVRHGLLFNFQKHFKTVLHSFGTGTRIPEDFEWASRERVADLIFHTSKNKKREAHL